MSVVNVNFNQVIGKIKPMHAVNNGPIKSGYEQHRSNFEEFKAAKIPFVRNHDASFCAAYGGEHTVDVHAIFPNFDADPYDPASYDFFYTDQYTRTILEAGSEVYYRLGTKIEHGGKKYGAVVPKDFNKWAVICEHIIRHYNEGWADGFHWNIRYWEIWNEPDGIAAGGDQPNWTGTPEQFYEMYSITSRHLKKCFPDLLIGGPAMSWVNETWLRGFLRRQKQDGSPVDFFGWHWYGKEVAHIGLRAIEARKILDEEGFPKTESYLNEWNYLENWTDQFISSIETIISMRGAAFTAAVMCLGQRVPIDMLMYYDARPCGFNGIFDSFSDPLPGYYSFLWFAELKDNGNEIRCDGAPENIYTLATKSASGKVMAALTYYTENEELAEPKEIEVKFGGIRPFAVYILDGETGKVSVEMRRDLDFTIKPFTTIFIREL